MKIINALEKNKQMGAHKSSLSEIIEKQDREDQIAKETINEAHLEQILKPVKEMITANFGELK